MPLDPTHVRLKLLHACDQRHSSRKFTPLTGLHCTLRPNTEGLTSILLAISRTAWCSLCAAEFMVLALCGRVHGARVMWQSSWCLPTLTMDSAAQHCRQGSFAISRWVYSWFSIHCTVLGFEQEFALEECYWDSRICSASSAAKRVTNRFPLGSPRPYRLAPQNTTQH
jgi:hypothetical protein